MREGGGREHGGGGGNRHSVLNRNPFLFKTKWEEPGKTFAGGGRGWSQKQLGHRRQKDPLVSRSLEVDLAFCPMSELATAGGCQNV